MKPIKPKTIQPKLFSATPLQQVLYDLNLYVFINFKTHTRAADYFNISRTHLGSMLSGKRTPNPRLLFAVGYTSKVVYLKTDEDNDND